MYFILEAWIVIFVLDQVIASRQWPLNRHLLTIVEQVGRTCKQFAAPREALRPFLLLCWRFIQLWKWQTMLKLGHLCGKAVVVVFWPRIWIELRCRLELSASRASGGVGWAITDHWLLIGLCSFCAGISTGLSSFDTILASSDGAWWFNLCYRCN